MSTVHYREDSVTLAVACVQGQKVLDLPPVSEKEVKVELSEADRGFYNIVRTAPSWRTAMRGDALHQHAR